MSVVNEVDRLMGNLGISLTPYAALTHVPLGILMQSAFGLPIALAGVTNAWWIGAMLSIGFWWGRKKFEFEYACKAKARENSVGRYWHKGWTPLNWSFQRQTEFYAPAIANLIMASLMTWGYLRASTET